ncbi:MAG TPA: RusA family crossover junction endodeoxyribonuclease [Gemmatimonadales bacterium]|nr:RusA family crossover junction endodeoxyribonuclease [Gemmatimonadales bacterium]
MTGIRLTLPVPPSANRWWRSVGPRVLLSREARDYKQTVATLLMVAKVKMIAPPERVRIRIVWYRARKSGDLDKRLGILLDGLQGQAYANDSQIVELSARREEDPDNPRMEVEITAMPGVIEERHLHAELVP